MKVVNIIGARPQFIKCAPVSRELRKVATEVLVHTGQHYDADMSEVFFRELQIPEPHFNLEVGSGPHGFQTGEMLKRIEEVLLAERPEAVIVYGDTNSTLAGALAAAKLHVPVAHVEAGLRSYNPRMPEEVNRVLTDHLSTLLFAPTETAVRNLQREGISRGVHLVGDVMYDVLREHVKLAKGKSRILERLRIKPKAYMLATVHRAENTEDLGRLGNILEAFCELSAIAPLVWPVHPRTRKSLEQLPSTCANQDGLRLIDPVPYLDMLVLEECARVILTDSGGVQKEAQWLEVPCVTLRDETEWVETVEAGWNQVVGSVKDKIVWAASRASPPAHVANRTCDRKGGVGRLIVDTILDLVKST